MDLPPLSFEEIDDKDGVGDGDGDDDDDDHDHDHDHDHVDAMFDFPEMRIHVVGTGSNLRKHMGVSENVVYP